MWKWPSTLITRSPEFLPFTASSWELTGCEFKCVEGALEHFSQQGANVNIFKRLELYVSAIFKLGKTERLAKAANQKIQTEVENKINHYAHHFDEHKRQLANAGLRVYQDLR